MEFNFSDNPIKDWHSDQNWILLDPTVKGFFSSLVLTSSQTKPYGHITSDEKKIKKLLGIPLVDIEDLNILSDFVPKSNDIIKTLKNFFEPNGKGISYGMLESLSNAIDGEISCENFNVKMQQNYDLWTAYLWKYKWKKQLESLIMIIDEDLVLSFPELSGREGDYFIPISYNIARIRNNTLQKKSSINTNETIKRKKSKKIEIIPVENIYFELDQDVEIKEEGLILWEQDLLKDLNLKKILSVFIKPLNEEEGKTIWDLGISLISTSSSKEDIGRARGIMAKMMKKYGKELTITTITKMSLTKEKYLNPHAYFIKLLEVGQEEIDKANAKLKTNTGEGGRFILL